MADGKIPYTLRDVPTKRSERSENASPKKRRFKLVHLEQDGPGAMTALTGGMAERLVDNTLAIPEQIARAGVGVANLGRAAIGQRMQGIPKDGVLGLPRGREVLAHADALLGSISGRSSELETALANRAQISQDNPIASGAGGLLGDAATLMAGRAPLVRPQGAFGPMGQPLGAATARGGGVFDDLADTAVNKLVSNTKTPGARMALDNVVKSDVVKRLARGAGRSLETGLEGAALAILQDQDPVQAAALSAGAQLGASGSLELARSVLGGSPSKATLKLTAAGVTGAALIQTLKSATPGGPDSILDAAESSFNKLAFSIAAGAVLGSMGRRASGQNLPLVSEALATVPRGAMVSLIKDISDKDPATADLTERAVLQLSRDPTAFSEKTQRTLLKALEERKFGVTVRNLAEKQPAFVSILENPTAAPDAQAILRNAVERDNAGAKRLPEAESIAKAIGSYEGSAAKFIAETLGDEGSAAAALSRLKPGARRNAALETRLTQMIKAATNRSTGKLRLSAKDLARQWHELPEITKQAYPHRKAIEAFIQEAQGQAFAVLPSLLSRSLMTDGQLTQQLTGANQNEPSGN